MPNLLKSILATRILLLFGAFAVTPAAAASFDGQWNVQIASTNSACSSGAAVSIGISNGKVESANAMMTASGRVAEAGAINVTLTSGIKRAVGSGHLTAATGSGIWHGTMCSGTWTAQHI
jgi:hypothetical protein